MHSLVQIELSMLLCLEEGISYLFLSLLLLIRISHCLSWRWHGASSGWRYVLTSWRVLIDRSNGAESMPCSWYFLNAFIASIWSGRTRFLIEGATRERCHILKCKFGSEFRGDGGLASHFSSHSHFHYSRDTFNN